MPADMDLLVNLIPDKSKLEGATDEPITQEVETEKEGGKTGGIMGVLGGKAEKGGMGEMGGMLAKIAVIAGGVMAIVKVLMGMKQIQKIMQMINKVMQLALLPFVNMLFTLLQPILINLIKLMPKWLNFWKDPVGNLMELAKWLGDKIGGFLSDLPRMIANAIGKIPRMIADALMIGSSAKSKGPEETSKRFEWVGRQHPEIKGQGSMTYAFGQALWSGLMGSNKIEEKNINQNVTINAPYSERSTAKDIKKAMESPY